jgi:prepilin-type N-terminal cleavage/methylation domain-containing protein
MKNKKGFTLIEMFIVLSIIGIVVAVLIPVACGDKKNRTYKNNTQYTERVDHNEDSTEEYTIITIDGCEYIKTGNILTHKANCKNPVHGTR